jgi:type III pantothenate kinase
MRNLVIDIGNTLSKVAVFNKQEIVYIQRYSQIELSTLIALRKEFNISKSILSNVNQENEKVENWLKEHTEYIAFSTKIGSKINSQYESKETLGLDRWAKVIAAYRLYPQQDCLLIDSGTCLTYDWISSDSKYLGGSISLGIQMRYNALHHFTKRLPAIELQADDWKIKQGINTTAAIKTGVIQGVLHEINGFIQEANDNYPNLNVILSGGDSIFLTEPLKNSIFAPQIIHEPYLVLKGLNEAISIENEQ